MKIEKNDKQLSCQNFLLLLTMPTQLNTRFVYSLNDAINQDVSIVPNFLVEVMAVIVKEQDKIYLTGTYTTQGPYV